MGLSILKFDLLGYFYRVLSFYGIALNDVERPGITGVQVRSGIVFVVLGRRVLDRTNQGFC